VSKKVKNKSKFREKLTYNYRLVILNESTLEEKLSFKLNRLNVYVLGGVFAIVLILLTSILIAFTPIKEYIPGYSSTKLKKTARLLVYKVDSLEQSLSVNKAYINNIKGVLTGDINSEEVKKNLIIQKQNNEELKLEASELDQAFRQDVEENDRFSLFGQDAKKVEIIFFSPIKGKITDTYSLKNKHLATDIAVKKGTPVKSVAEGTVIFSGFTANTGHVIIIEHKQGFLSVYKHNATLFKEQGDMVKAGEVIANAGSTGKHTTGPHLHFELWREGYPVNPTDFVDFE
jgi:murein DD-endopeptidase MepM/ murein hydrolase activator NlpD